jgi:uncharacterized protein DUF6788
VARSRADRDRLRRLVQERLREQRTLVRALLALREQVQGSLFTRYGRCGKTGCTCQRDRLHGPYYVLSGSEGGRGFVYLDGPRVARARELVKRSREFRRGLRRLRVVSSDLVRQLRRYQRSTARRGRERLRIGSEGAKKMAS